MNASFFKTWIVYGLITVAILATAVPARAGIIVAGTEQAHLDFASDPMFQSVGWLRGERDGSAYFAGSAVLIHPEWVLTVGHTMDDGWTSVQFGLTDDFRDPDRTLYGADAWYLYPGFVSDGGAGTNNDIALLHLITPIFGVTPADIYWGEVIPDTHAYWAGYARLGYYPSGESGLTGTKRAGENVVGSIGSAFLGVHDQYFLADYGPAWGTPTLALEMQGSSGDSGGGWFADYNGQMQLIGLTAFGRGNFYDTGAIRPAVYQDWIEGYVQLSVPEPSISVLILTITPLAVRHRHKRRMLDAQWSERL